MYKLKKTDNRGFTLLELLVAMTIFTIVIFIGYRIFNDITKSVKDKGNINRGQLTMNDMNNYITDDLEQSSSVTLSVLLEDINISQQYEDEIDLSNIDDKFNSLISQVGENNKLIYTYTIKSNNEINNNLGFSDSKTIAEYIVNVYLKNSDCTYSISRKDYNNTNISFVKDGILEELNPPFTIKGGNPYEVSMQYNGKNNKVNKHTFNVVSRFLVGSSSGGNNNGGDNGDGGTNPEIPIPPDINDIRPPGFSDYAMVGYWTADYSKRDTENLYTWIVDNKVVKGSVYGDQKIYEDSFNIKGEFHPGPGQQNEECEIGLEGKWGAKLPKQGETITVNKSISKISIYVSPYTTLEVSQFNKQGGSHNNIYITESDNYNGKQVVTGGSNGTWYTCEFGKENVNHIYIEGEISINKKMVSSGYALVAYGEEDISKSADLIFDYLDLDTGLYPNQRSVTYGAGFKSINGKYTYATTRNISVDEKSLYKQQVYIHIRRWNNEHQIYVRTWGQGGKPDFTINDSDISTTIANISKIRITMDNNITLHSSDKPFIEKDNVYEINVTGDALALNLYFDITKLDTGDLKSGRVYVELIE